MCYLRAGTGPWAHSPEVERVVRDFSQFFPALYGCSSERITGLHTYTKLHSIDQPRQASIVCIGARGGTHTRHPSPTKVLNWCHLSVPTAQTHPSSEMGVASHNPTHHQQRCLENTFPDQASVVCFFPSTLCTRVYLTQSA